MPSIWELSTLIRAILRALFELVELLLGIDGRAAMQPPNLRLDSGMSLFAMMGLMVKGTNYAYNLITQIMHLTQIMYITQFSGNP